MNVKEKSISGPFKVEKRSNQKGVVHYRGKADWKDNAYPGIWQEGIRVFCRN